MVEKSYREMPEEVAVPICEGFRTRSPILHCTTTSFFSATRWKIMGQGRRGKVDTVQYSTKMLRIDLMDVSDVRVDGWLRAIQYRPYGLKKEYSTVQQLSNLSSTSFVMATIPGEKATVLC